MSKQYDLSKDEFSTGWDEDFDSFYHYPEGVHIEALDDTCVMVTIWRGDSLTRLTLEGKNGIHVTESYIEERLQKVKTSSTTQTVTYSANKEVNKKRGK